MDGVSAMLACWNCAFTANGLETVIAYLATISVCLGADFALRSIRQTALRLPQLGPAPASGQEALPPAPLEASEAEGGGEAAASGGSGFGSSAVAAPSAPAAAALAAPSRVGSLLRLRRRRKCCKAKNLLALPSAGKRASARGHHTMLRNLWRRGRDLEHRLIRGQELAQLRAALEQARSGEVHMSTQRRRSDEMYETLLVRHTAQQERLERSMRQAAHWRKRLLRADAVRAEAARASDKRPRVRSGDGDGHESDSAAPSRQLRLRHSLPGPLGFHATDFHFAKGTSGTLSSHGDCSESEAPDEAAVVAGGVEAIADESQERAPLEAAVAGEEGVESEEGAADEGEAAEESEATVGYGGVEGVLADGEATEEEETENEHEQGEGAEEQTEKVEEPAANEEKMAEPEEERAESEEERAEEPLELPPAAARAPAAPDVPAAPVVTLARTAPAALAALSAFHHTLTELAGPAALAAPEADPSAESLAAQFLLWSPAAMAAPAAPSSPVATAAPVAPFAPNAPIRPAVFAALARGRGGGSGGGRTCAGRPRKRKQSASPAAPDLKRKGQPPV